ncbi:MAG: FAD-binding protein [Anaerolineae bacterium]
MEHTTIPGSATPLTWVHTLIIGSGAAGLNAAVQLAQAGVRDLLILTEGLRAGASINTGSDKQTYYKLSLCGDEADSPRALAETLFAGGSMHGDIALVEASLSARAFYHLVDLGVPFPHDEYGQYVGYKTDHDPRQRASSIGPYTSREMCRALIRRVGELGIAVRQGRVATQLLGVDGVDAAAADDADAANGPRRCCGALAIDAAGALEAYLAENVVLAVGGPGGLYAASVYPPGHTGGIGLALRLGARARNLPDLQFGLASLGFRWNVSGSYLQAMPRVLSAAAGSAADDEFLAPYFASAGELHSRLFQKGYQWPTDAERVSGGSSLIDLLVYRETARRGRRVYLDYTRNGAGYDAATLSDEARGYLERSHALRATPLERLRALNPAALALYAEHGIDLARQPLEVAICAQHNNGGLAADVWCESENIAHLFPIGEVNGSHGARRPGGAALNAGQVAGFRVAGRIAHRYAGWTLPREAAVDAAAAAVDETLAWLARCASAPSHWRAERAAWQERLSRYGGPIRALGELPAAIAAAWAQCDALEARGCAYHAPHEAAEALRNRQLAFAQAVYLEAMRHALASGVGSRGSAIALDPRGAPIHPLLGDAWRLAPEDLARRGQVLETAAHGPRQVEGAWAAVRPIPAGDAWFETAWARYVAGEVWGP